MKKREEDEKKKKKQRLIKSNLIFFVIPPLFVNGKARQILVIFINSHLGDSLTINFQAFLQNLEG